MHACRTLTLAAATALSTGASAPSASCRADTTKPSAPPARRRGARVPPSEASDSRSGRLAGCRDRTCVGKHGEIKHTRAAQRPAPQPGRNQLARPASVRTCRRVSGCSSLAVAARGGPSRPASREGRPPELPPASGAAGAVPRAPAAGAELAAARVGAAAAAAAGLTAATLGAPAATAGAARGGCTAACCTCRCCGCCCESGEPKSTVMDAGCCGCGGCTPPLAAAAVVRRWAGSLLCRRRAQSRAHGSASLAGPCTCPHDRTAAGPLSPPTPAEHPPRRAGTGTASPWRSGPAGSRSSPAGPAAPAR